MQTPLPTVQKAQCVGHMTHFRKECDDWKKVFQLLDSIGTGLYSSKKYEEALAIANAYAQRQYPSYQMHPFPTSFQTVDNVVVWREAGKILLGRKPTQKLYQFPGGFVDPSDDNLEKAAERERQEECTIGFDDMECSVGCICSHPEYIGSFRVQDPRYAGSPDKIMSAVMLSFYVDGTPKAGDDLKEVRWFTKDYLRRHYRKAILPIHHPLISLLINKGYL